MDRVDRDIQEAERDASPERFPWVEPQLSSSSTEAALKSTSSGRVNSAGTSASRPDADVLLAPTLRLHPTELDRIATHRLWHSATVGGSRPNIAQRNTTMKTSTLGAGKPFPPTSYNVEDYLVEFDGPHDPIHPQNWPMKKKVIISLVLAYITFVASFASAIYSPAISGIEKRFHISQEVGTLGISLYVLGFASGPIIWAPLSELSGRKIPLTLGIFGFGVFSMGVAASKDTQTLMLCRYFAGFFSASPLAVVPACYADMYDHKQRGVAMTAFAMAVFVGPFASPFIGGFITMSYLGWRWTMYISGIMGFLGFGLMIIFYKETYPPAILVTKAGRLRRETHDWRIHAKQEEVEVGLHDLITNNFSRPLRMLVSEPIILLMTVYMSFVYGLMYAFLGAYPLVFQGVHGMNKGVGGLPFLGLIVGQVAAGIYIMLTTPQYNKKLDANNGVTLPEWRLPPVVVGAFAFCGGLFWFGWTGYTSSIHWMAPTASGVLTGFGLLCIFLQCFNYLIDSYLMFAASTIAANTLLRSIAGAGFPLFTVQMFNNLGIQWAGTLLGCLAAIMIPIPIAFTVYGPRLRQKSKFALSKGPDLEKVEDEEKGE